MNFYDYFNLYGPFVITLVCAIVVTVVFVRRHRRRQEHVQSAQSSSRRAAAQAARKPKKPAPAAGPRPQRKETAPRKRLEQLQVPSGMTICPRCKMKVFARADGTCPSCQAKIKPGK